MRILNVVRFMTVRAIKFHAGVVFNQMLPNNGANGGENLQLSG